MVIVAVEQRLTVVQDFKYELDRVHAEEIQQILLILVGGPRFEHGENAVGER